jgi:signal transduction histidine kinase
MGCNKICRILRNFGPKQRSATIFVCLLVWLVCSRSWAEPSLPPSVLVLDQSAPLRPWSTAIMHAVQSVKSDKSGRPISYHVEHLDLFGFGRRQYEENLLSHLIDKYSDKPIGAILSIGPGALDFAVKLRAAGWPAVPIVFTAVTEESAPQPLPPKTTGFFVHKTFANMVKAAQTIWPDLRRLVLVGNPFDGGVYYPQFASEVPTFSAKFEIIDLMGLPVSEILRRVAVLPPDTAIFYFGINADAEMRYASAVEALPLIAEASSRPIIGDAETEIGAGAVGGFVLRPHEIGLDAGRLVMRILDGEEASEIPVATNSTTLKPMFDWRQLQRWNISESMLPMGSEIRFRPPGIWEQYSLAIMAAIAALLFQAGLIVWLIGEHRRRQLAEISTRNAMAELTYMNRHAAAGELSASIAHEVSQPLTGIVARASAARRWLAKETPDIEKTRAALNEIEAAGHRASDILRNVRSMFKKQTDDKSQLDVNRLIGSVLDLSRIDLRKHRIDVRSELDDRLPPVLGNEVQLQQVILNLVLNAIDAMRTVEPRVLSVESKLNGHGTVHVSVEDTGGGIAPSDRDQIFKPLFTTKGQGMGMGLSICRSIIENHSGRIWVLPGVNGGSVFQFELPTTHDEAELRDIDFSVELARGH